MLTNKAINLNANTITGTLPATNIAPTGGGTAQDYFGFATRAAFVTWASGKTPAVGTVIFAEGYGYLYLGSGTVLSGLPGWIWRTDKTVNHFGAVGDGVTDDRPAFVLARDSVGAGLAGKIIVPPGAYLLSSSISSDNGNFIDWEIQDGATILPSVALRISGATRRISHPRTGTAKYANVIGLPVSGAGGDTVGKYTEVANTGLLNQAAYGNRLGYRSSAYGASGFDIGQATIAQFTRTVGNGGGQGLAEWLVVTTPTTGDGTAANGWGMFCAEWNMVNRGLDTGFTTKRSLLQNWTGMFQVVVEDDLLALGTLGTNVTFGIMFGGQTPTGLDVDRRRFYAAILGEPDAIAGLTGRAIFWSGDTTAQANRIPLAFAEAAERWAYDLKLNTAVFDTAAVALGTGHKVSWQTSVGVEQARIEATATDLILTTDAEGLRIGALGAATLSGAATATGLTKAVNIGTAGASGSITNVQIGSAVAGSLGTTTINSPTVTFGATVTAINVPDSAFTLQDNVDATKKAKFELSGLTTASTRTYTLPDIDGTVASLAAAQTFTGVNTFSNLTNNFGSSAADTSITNLGNGATAAALTKTVRVGTDGLLNSITNVNIGSSVAGALGTTSIRSPTVIAKGQVQAQAGTAALPSYSFELDPDTGITNITANTLGMSVGGVDQARLTAGRLAVIGTATETQTLSAGFGRTGDGASALALVSDTTYPNGSDIFTRLAGANGIMDVRHQGTGAFQIVLAGAAPFTLSQNGITTIQSAAGGTFQVNPVTATTALNLGAGATISGATKTLAIGTGGVAGSTTNITIGSTIGTATTINSTTVTIAGADICIYQRL